MKSTFSSYTYFNGNRKIGGTAAYNHFFKENGGIDNVLNHLAAESAEIAIKKMLKELSFKAK